MQTLTDRTEDASGTGANAASGSLALHLYGEIEKLEKFTPEKGIKIGRPGQLPICEKSVITGVGSIQHGFHPQIKTRDFMKTMGFEGVLPQVTSGLDDGWIYVGKYVGHGQEVLAHVEYTLKPGKVDVEIFPYRERVG